MIAESWDTQITDSWHRCINQYNLHASEYIKPPRLTESEIRIAQQEFHDQFHPAMMIFNKLAVVGQRFKHRIHATDVNGTLLIDNANLKQTPLLTDNELALGSVFGEKQVGTNAAGTCLTTGKPISVHASEHFSNAFHGFTCSSAPLISPFGEVVGALSVASHAGNHKSEHAWVLKQVCETASEIEAAIFRVTYARYHLLMLTLQGKQITDQSTAMIAVNDSGWIIGVTSTAIQALNIKQRSQLVGQSLYSVFGYSLDQLYQNRWLALRGADEQRSEWFISLLKKIPSKIMLGLSSKKQLQPDNKVQLPIYQFAGGDSHLLRNADICYKLKDKNIPILLSGETGTGKEVWARAIHDSSERSDGPFVTLNCAAIPESLIESELFGYSSGTFTGGLKKGKVGKIESSQGGTLFLDEIGDMPLALQARLLRVLAEKEVTPLGQVEPIKVNFNIICATHRNLRAKVEEGSFREDLYYRISGVSLTLTALRNRSDRHNLIETILETVNQTEGISIDPYAMSILNRYEWPGNIRQLKNVLHYASSMCDANIVRMTDLPDEVFQVETKETNVFEPVASKTAQITIPMENEKERILNALNANRWVVAQTARVLDVSRSTLHRKIKSYGLNRDNT